ncbi:ABC transporter ATP-binding protein [Ferrimicrobium sp.]|uniref:Dipeptide ABC transporter ATP-binding protein n=1 Tax=Ferrimicrobium acidiphilum TaxID=121039 RepID=A0ABV3Y425_9ACTN|nr:ABC transporter ATP-binding protein [Ferrimicrobium sp.]
MPLLEVRDLRVEIAQRQATVHALDGVSLTVNSGETVGLVGESGSGKTMTGMAVMGLLPKGGSITTGEILLNGRDLAKCSEKEMQAVRGMEVGMVFQDPMTALNPTMTIGRQVAEPLRRHLEISKAAARDRVVELLSLVGMPRPKEQAREYPHQLSGGLRQRVVIAIALACNPKLLIADEPTTALDVTIQAQILDLLDHLRVQLQLGVILITHDMGIVAGRADRVEVMYAGRIVEEAPTEDLFFEPRHPYAEALLASLPDLESDRSRGLFAIGGLPPDLSHPPANCRFAERCMYTRDECKSTDPHLSELGGGRSVACLFPRAANRLAEIRVRPSREELLVDSSAVDHSADRTAGALLDAVGVAKEFKVSSRIQLRRRAAVTLKAVSGVSLMVMPGETLGLVGESGCGKTTLGRMLAGLEVPSDGTIRFQGEEVSGSSGNRMRRLRRDLQMMFQDPYASLDPRMRVGSIIEEPMRLQHVGSHTERQARVRQLMGEVGLSLALIDRYPHEFSGGQRQRIGLARALSLNPKLLVADEPVSALDVSIRSQVINLMCQLQETHGLTYVVISHDLSVVRYMADRVAVMYLGKIVEIGPTASLYARPAHPYTDGLLKSIPVPDPMVARTRREASVTGELPSAINPPSGCRFRTRCPRAASLCAEVEPVLRDFGGGQAAACHFPLQPSVLEGQPQVPVGDG